MTVERPCRHVHVTRARVQARLCPTHEISPVLYSFFDHHVQSNVLDLIWYDSNLFTELVVVPTPPLLLACCRQRPALLLSAYQVLRWVQQGPVVVAPTACVAARLHTGVSKCQHMIFKRHVVAIT